MRAIRLPAPRLTLPVLASVAAVLGGASAAQAAPAPGVSIVAADAGEAHVAADLTQAKALGARLVRYEIGWSWLEPAAAGRRDPARLAEVDKSMARARALGLRVVLLLDQTPCWTSTAPPADQGACGVDGSAYPPADYGAYASLGAFLSARYSKVLAGFEVWNEPDQANERYWAGPNKVQRYVALLKATYPMIKKAAPKVPVLGGAFVGTDGRWLKAMYAQGAKGFYDGLSVHFYDLGLLGLRQTRAVQRANHDAAPLWLLEAGWNSCKPNKRGTEGQPCVSHAGQATDLRDLFAQVRRTSWVKAVVVFKLRDDASDRFGLLTGSGARKPSFTALQRVFKRGAGRATRLVVRTRSRGGAVRVSGSGPDGDLYRLTVRLRGALRYRAEFRMDAGNRFTVTLPAQLGTRGLVVRVEQPWSHTAVTRRT